MRSEEGFATVNPYDREVFFLFTEVLFLCFCSQTTKVYHLSTHRANLEHRWQQMRLRLQHLATEIVLLNAIMNHVKRRETCGNSTAGRAKPAALHTSQPKLSNGLGVLSYPFFDHYDRFHFAPLHPHPPCATLCVVAYVVFLLSR